MKPVCLITGAAGRLGQALAVTLAESYEVVAVYRHTLPELSSQLRWRVNLREEASESPPNIYCVQADLQRREDVRRLVEVAMARHGRIDAVINSAADVKFHGKLCELWEADDYALPQLFVNCVVPMLLTSAVHQACWKDQPQENARWNRSVVNVSSVSGLYAFPESGQAFYSASKAALNMLTLYLAQELAPYSVRANALCPGKLTDAPKTQRVIEVVRRLLEGTDTGTIFSNFSAPG